MFDKYDAFLNEPTINYIYPHFTYINGVENHNIWYSYVVFPYGEDGVSLFLSRYNG